MMYFLEVTTANSLSMGKEVQITWCIKKKLNRNDIDIIYISFKLFGIQYVYLYIYTTQLQNTVNGIYKKSDMLYMAVFIRSLGPPYITLYITIAFLYWPTSTNGAETCYTIILTCR